MGTASALNRVARLLFGLVRRDVLALLLRRPDEQFYLLRDHTGRGRGLRRGAT
jgi:hypothetical protein